MIRMCMIAHDQIERSNPRADLVRFKCLGETLAMHSIDVVFITLNDKPQYEESYYKNSRLFKIPSLSRIKFIQLICFCGFLLPVMIRARRSVRFDIIFVNSVLSIPGALMFKWLSGYGFIQFDLMGILSEERFIGRSRKFWVGPAKKMLSAVENFLLSRVDFVTTINEKHRQIITNRIRRPVHVIRDGVHEEVLRRVSIWEKGRPSVSKILLIFVGQISHFRLDSLLRVMPDILEEVPDLQLQVVGSGPHLARYMEMVRSLGLKDKVIFEGHVPHEEVFDYIKRADIAYSEDWSINGFPMKIFEYLALGKAIVAEGTESVREVLTDRVNGLLYSNEAELKEKILALAKDTVLREKLGKAARGMMDQHTWEKRVETLKGIYQQYISQMEMA